MTLTRAAAWICVLAVLLAVALPAAGGPPAILAPAFVLDAPPVAVRLSAPDRTPAPDLSVAASVPARAPPLA
jgi:hypothetical protein